MCGIIGYCGASDAVPVLLSGLSALEYRGYDSAGIAVFTGGGRDTAITTVKSKGRIAELKDKISAKHSGSMPHSSCGIGHTRWATHGEPSDVNSHPHGTKKLALVHNGIIENYAELKKELCALGYEFESATDTEVAAKLIDYCYSKLGNKFRAIEATCERLRGSYAFGIMFADEPDTVYALRKDSPLIAVKGSDGAFVASDITAVLGYASGFYQLEHGEIAVIKEGNVKFFSLDGKCITKQEQKVTWDITSAEKEGYDHFMIKEIHEEPSALERTFSRYMKDGLPEFDVRYLAPGFLRQVHRIHIVACGTAMHAGLVGKYVIEKLARVQVNVDIASEFRYSDPVLDKSDLFIALSQSGETADTLAALRLAKQAGLKTVAIVNVVGSSIAREADSVLYTCAGPEIAVASTKAYSVQLALMYMLAIHIASCVGKIDADTAGKLISELCNDVPCAIKQVLSLEKHIKRVARGLIRSEDMFFIGRGVDSYLASEASLKLKEVSYIHSEAYAAGELKHGTISLITQGVPVVAIATSEALLEKTLSNVKECNARGASALVICKSGMNIPEEIAASDRIISLPCLSEIFMPFAACCAFQILAYYVAVIRGCDVDKPRNLAKSVTVE